MKSKLVIWLRPIVVLPLTSQFQNQLLASCDSKTNRTRPKLVANGHHKGIMYPVSHCAQRHNSKLMFSWLIIVNWVQQIHKFDKHKNKTKKKTLIRLWILQEEKSKHQTSHVSWPALLCWVVSNLIYDRQFKVRYLRHFVANWKKFKSNIFWSNFRKVGDIFIVVKLKTMCCLFLKFWHINMYNK